MQARRLTGLSTAALVILAGPASAQNSIADFYKGKDMKILVGSGAGGGYDSYARFVARYLGTHIPGNPTLTVQNMPGAGGLRAANFLYNNAPKDGTVIAHLQRTTPSHKILGLPGAQYEPQKFTWLGSLNNEVIVCVARKEAAAKTAQDLFTKETFIGGAGAAADSETVPAILNNILGAKIKIISGYPSTTEIAIAVDRGEIDGYCGSYSSVVTSQKRWFSKDGDKVNFLIQVSNSKHPDLPNVPLAIDFTKTSEDRTLMELNDSRLVMGRPFVAPPDIPAERATTLQNAFWSMVTDATFKADAIKYNRELNPVSGPDVKALVDRITKVDQKLIAKLNDALVYKGAKGVAKIEMLSATGTVTETVKGGRSIAIKTGDDKPFKANISAAQTKVTIKGSAAERDAIATGMTCTIKAPSEGAQAVSVDCK